MSNRFFPTAKFVFNTLTVLCFLVLFGSHSTRMCWTGRISCRLLEKRCWSWWKCLPSLREAVTSSKSIRPSSSYTEKLSTTKSPTAPSSVFSSSHIPTAIRCSSSYVSKKTFLLIGLLGVSDWSPGCFWLISWVFLIGLLGVSEWSPGCFSLVSWVFLIGLLGVSHWSPGCFSLISWVPLIGLLGVSHWSPGCFWLVSWVFLIGLLGVSNWSPGCLSLISWVFLIGLLSFFFKIFTKRILPLHSWVWILPSSKAKRVILSSF